eukprot:9348674-Heterocapsa_arctica.AAC.1
MPDAPDEKMHSHRRSTPYTAEALQLNAIMGKLWEQLVKHKFNAPDEKKYDLRTRPSRSTEARSRNSGPRHSVTYKPAPPDEKKFSASDSPGTSDEKKHAHRSKPDCTDEARHRNKIMGKLWEQLVRHIFGLPDATARDTVDHAKPNASNLATMRL